MTPNSKTQPYKAWAQMKYMCSTDNPKFKPEYKDKGISYEANFKNFSLFWKALGWGWCPGAKLARKDTSKWFTENNCYWQPPKNAKPYTKAKCATGVWGLKRCTDKEGYTSWVVRKTDSTGRRVSKWWSIKKYGEVYGFMLALTFLRENNN